MDSRKYSFLILMNADKLFSEEEMPNSTVTNNTLECLFHHIITEKLEAINVLNFFGVSCIG